MRIIRNIRIEPSGIAKHESAWKVQLSVIYSSTKIRYIFTLPTNAEDAHHANYSNNAKNTRIHVNVEYLLRNCLADAPLD